MSGSQCAAEETGLSKEITDSVRIYFKGGSSIYDPALRENRAVLSDYLARIRSLNERGALEEVTIRGYVSPDGSEAFNRRLAERRCNTLADILISQAGVEKSRIHTIPVGIDWAELRSLIAGCSNVPYKKSLLNIIDNTPVWVFDKQGKIIGGRKKSMMDLRGGRPYNWLYANIFPEMRNAVAISISYTAPEADPSDDETDSAISEDAINDTPLQSSDLVVIPADEMEEECEVVEVSTADAAVSEDKYHEPLHALALKTNLLYYAALLPNLELEWYINDKWSVTVEGNLAWWGRYSHDRSYRLLVVAPEARYWFLRGPRRRGLFTGVTVGGGMYDFLKDTRGYRGEGVMAGVLCGYQWPISRNLSLEAEIAAGYLYTKVSKYQPFEGHHIFQKSKAINYFGPLKLKFSLVWRFLDINRQKERRAGI